MGIDTELGFDVYVKGTMHSMSYRRLIILNLIPSEN